MNRRELEQQRSGLGTEALYHGPDDFVDRVWSVKEEFVLLFALHVQRDLAEP